MPDVIKDGKGTGYLAAVNKENQLVVKAVQVSNIHYRSIQGDAYIIPLHYKQVLGGTAGYAGYVTYTGVRQLVGSQLTISTHEAGLTIVELKSACTMTGGMAGTAGNLNSSSSKTLPATIIMQYDGYFPFTPSFDGFPIIEMSGRNSTSLILDAKDSLIIKPNSPLYFKVNCDTTNSLVRIYITCYEMD